MQFTWSLQGLYRESTEWRRTKNRQGVA
jgi:hypothetical protein